MVMRIAWTTCALAAVLFAPGFAAAQTTGCTAEITSLPYSIWGSGTYCLKSTIFTNLASGAAITVSGGYSVTVDLRGFAIINQYGSASEAIGVLAGNKSNVTVRNGKIMNFRSGVTLDGTNSYGNVVEDVQVDAPIVVGIVISGKGHQVRRCAVTKYGLPGDDYGSGMLVSGTGHVIEDNQILESQTSLGIGISSGLSTDILFAGNRIMHAPNFGMHLCATCRYRDNVVIGASQPYYSGIDLGGNHP
jgi:hypothetical protein